MSRLGIDLVAQSANATSHIVSSLPTASVTVFARNANGTSGSAAIVYQSADPSILTPLSQPLAVDSQGRIPGWLDPGDYNVVVAAPGFTTETTPYSVAGTGGSGAQLADNFDTVFADTRWVVNAGDAYIVRFFDSASPGVTWLDSSGALVQPGLYLLGLQIWPRTVGSGTGQYVYISGDFQTTMLPIDPMESAANTPVDFPDLGVIWANQFVLSHNDIKVGGGYYSEQFPGVGVTLPSTATGWALNYQLYFTRLLKG